MKFSQTTTLEGLVQDITFLTGLDTNAIGLKDRARLCNRWYYRAAILAWKFDPDWQFDDPNIAVGQTDQSWTYDATFVGLPRAKHDLTDDVRMYRLPTNALSIERVEVLRANADWILLDRIEENKIPKPFAVSEYHETKGLPRFYNLVGSNIELFPAPSSSEVTATAGLKIYVSREVDEFVSTDDTQEPGIPEPFHRILSLGASYDIALAKGLNNAAQLKKEVEQLLFEMQEYYTKRNRYNVKRIIPSIKNPI